MTELDKNVPPVDLAVAAPTKSFFVQMLVRDIELQDAILDLLDNCVDGILRSAQPNLALPLPYKDFRADIVVSPKGFRISDNCGGIPIEIARTSAFAVGKPVPIKGAEAIATVGMYGIGMKRAIFKFGSDATVTSYNDQPFQVRIDPAWMASEEWSPLPIKVLEIVDGLIKGTKVEVTNLHKWVSDEFDAEAFVDELKRTIARQYSLIIAKGFSVTVSRDLNADTKKLALVEGEKFRLLMASKGEGEALAPYIYKGTLDGVDVEIFAGLYRQLLTDEERELEEETRGSSDEAGWTVACNDRVVIWKDRSRLTGWGEASVPNFHGQFIAITGLVQLRSSDPKLLPLTTTKRGIDGASDVYSKAKDLMRDATKGLTSFTNKWKRFPEELDKIYTGSQYSDLNQLNEIAKEKLSSPSAKAFNSIKSVIRSVPILPTPPQHKTDDRISFSAPKTEVQLLAKAYFGDQFAKPKSVGEHAFKQEVSRAMKAGGQ